MKKAIISFVILLTCGAGYAQSESKSFEDIAQIQTTKMSEKYSLTADQSEEIYQINLTAAVKKEEVKSLEKLTSEEYQSKIEDIKAQQRSKIEKVLNQVQVSKFIDDNEKYDLRESKIKENKTN